MVTYFILFILFAILSVLALVLMILAIIKKRKRRVLYSIVALFISVGITGLCGFMILKKVLSGRSGEEIYTALFGKSESDCFDALHHQDQIAPIIDYAIFLHFRTCPQEMQRILQQQAYQYEIMATSDMFGTSGPEWFQPELLGDSVIIFSYARDEYGNGQTLYTSMDSTEVHLIDVWD